LDLRLPKPNTRDITRFSPNDNHIPVVIKNPDILGFPEKLSVARGNTPSPITYILTSHLVNHRVVRPPQLLGRSLIAKNNRQRTIDPLGFDHRYDPKTVPEPLVLNKPAKPRARNG